MEKTTIQIKSPADTIKVQSILVALMQDLDNKKSYDITIQQHREKRSLNANNYSWYLQDKIAKVLNKSIEDVHNEMVLSYGVLETYSIKKCAFESAKRMFDYFEVLGESEVNGKEFVHIRAGIGTHNYNTLEMSKFLDGVVQEAEQLGIEVRTPAQLAELKSLWEKGEI